MSNETQKADQIAHRFYTKLTLVVYHARATLEPLPQAKVDKWFNLETPDPDILKEHTRLYRSISSAASTPAFRLQVVLRVPELTNNQVLLYLPLDSTRQQVDPTPRFILLESWDITFSPRNTYARPGVDEVDVAPATMYKHGVPLFRSIFTLLRIIPAWKLARRLRRRTVGRNGHFSIELRVQAGDDGREGILGFDSPFAPGRGQLAQDAHAFPPITHPSGTLAFSVTYLTAPHFEVDERESHLSRFLSLDEGTEFTPTLVKNQQRDSLSTSPGSLPMRTSLPRSPPSVADRFVVPPPISSRATSFPTHNSSPRMQNVALPSTRRPSNAGLGATGSASGLSDASSSRQGTGSVGEGQTVSALAARLRRESTGMVRGGDHASAPGPVPIRRSPINPVNPFKSSTLSSGSPSLHSPSPSLRQHSPLSSLPGGAGPSLPSRPAYTSPTSSRAISSTGPIGSRAPSSPVTPFRPSPPFAPSSLGGRSLASAEGALAGVSESPRLASGKRYSSSFGHRYAATGGAGSEGSAGSGAKEGERVAGASFLSTNTDDDDISAFVQDIDARKPLVGMREQSTPPQTVSPEEDSSSGREERSPSVHSRTRTGSMPEPMLATEAAVDERLREMNEAFMTSLRGLGGRRRARQGSGNGSGATTENRPDRAEGVGSGATRIDIGGIALPPEYVRPRLGSAASAGSGFSIASGEVLGRMDPEVPGDTGRCNR